MASISNIRGQLWVLGLLRGTEAAAWASIFPYAYYMLQSFHEVPDQDIAFYTGLLVAVVTFGEFLSAMAWARISDRIGRKPTLLIGTAFGTITAVSLGLSRSIAAAVASRAFGGLLSANASLVQTCTGEIARREQQAKAFSLITFIRALGNLIGPVMGGLLADPVALYPSIFPQESIWTTYRYLLPNLVVALMQLFTFGATLLVLKETHPHFEARRDPGLALGQSIGKLLSKILTGHNRSEYMALDRSSGAYTDESREGFQHEDLRADTTLAEPSTESTALIPDATTCETMRPGIWGAQVVLQILAISLLACHKVSFDTLMATFLALPSTSKDSVAPNGFPGASRGFGLSTQHIALVFLTETAFRVAVQFAVVSVVIDRVGALKSYRWVLGIYPATYLLTPFLPNLPSGWQMGVLLPDLWIKVAMSSVGYVCSAILITNTAPSGEALARINGAAASFGCLARSLGPLLSGKLLTMGIAVQHLEIPFWTLSGVALLGFLVTPLLTDHA